MSRKNLKKELSQLDREQLIEVIMTAYSSNKAIKDYFDFFAEPDIDKLFEKHRTALGKEITRSKRRQSTARISRIKKTIKDFESFNPGAELSISLRLFAVESLIDQESVKTYSETLIKGTLKLLNDTLAFADRKLLFDGTIEAVDKLLSEEHTLSISFRRFLRNNIDHP